MARRGSPPWICTITFRNGPGRAKITPEENV